MLVACGPSLHSEGNRWGDDPDGGMEEPIFSKFCFGQKVAPKEAFGAKMSGITTEFDEEAESAIENAPKALKRDLFDLFFWLFKIMFSFFSSPHRFIPPSVPFRLKVGRGCRSRRRRAGRSETRRLRPDAGDLGAVEPPLRPKRTRRCAHGASCWEKLKVYKFSKNLVALKTPGGGL